MHIVPMYGYSSVYSVVDGHFEWFPIFCLLAVVNSASMNTLS